MRLEKLRVNNIENPMGFAICPLSFSWIVTDENAPRISLMAEGRR